MPTFNDGCRYIIDDTLQSCGGKRQPGSSYCPEHHALCHLPRHSSAERRQIRQINWISNAVGGRQATATLAELMDKLAAIEARA
jgi:hypothetical protein